MVSVQPHNGIGTKFLYDCHCRNAKDTVNNVYDAVEGTNIRLDDGGIDTAALYGDGYIIIGARSGEIESSVTVGRFHLNPPDQNVAFFFY